MSKSAIFLMLFVFSPALPAAADSCDHGFRALSASALRESVFDMARAAPLRVAKEAGTFLFYPTLAPARLMDSVLDARKAGRSMLWAPVDFVRKDGVRIGLVAGSYTMGHEGPMSFVNYIVAPGNRLSDYEKQLDNREREDGLTIYVDGVARDNFLAGLAETEFQRMFGGQKNAHLIRAEGLEDMTRKIRALAAEKNKPVVRLEILGHGKPGYVKINQDALTTENAGALRALRGAFGKDAEIRFTSCLLGANGGFLGNGPELLEKIGKEALGEGGGGSVFASSRVIYVDVPYEHKDESPLGKKAFEEFLDPLGEVVADAYTNAVALERRLQGDRSGNYIKIQVPPARSGR